MPIFIKKCSLRLKNRVLGTGVSDVRGRTKQQDEGNYKRRFIICTLLAKKKI